jgi:hypothetical protein
MVSMDVHSWNLDEFVGEVNFEYIILWDEIEV